MAKMATRGDEVRLIFGVVLLLATVPAAALTLVLDGQSRQVQSVTIAGDGTMTVQTGTPAPAPEPAPTPKPPATGCPAGSVIAENLSKEKTYRTFKTGETRVFRFTTETAGRLSLGSLANVTASSKLVTLSRCPGDFRVDTLADRCALSGEFVTLRYNSDPGVATQCTVTAGQTYYLNVKNGILSLPGADTCPAGATCGFYLQRY